MIYSEQKLDYLNASGCCGWMRVWADADFVAVYFLGHTYCNFNRPPYIKEHRESNHAQKKTFNAIIITKTTEARPQVDFFQVPNPHYKNVAWFDSPGFALLIKIGFKMVQTK